MIRLIRRRLTNKEIDRLLRRTLRDDLPQGEEIMLLAQLRAAWRDAQLVPQDSQTGDDELAGRPLSGGANRAEWGVRVAWIGVAVALLVAVAIAQMTGSGGLLAESLSVRHMFGSILAQMRQSEEMLCWLEAPDSSGQTRRYLVHWKAAGETQIRIQRPEGDIDRTVRLLPTTAALLDRGPRPAGAVETLDPLLAPVRDYLSPDRLGGLLQGRWEVLRGVDGSPNILVRIGLPGESRILYLTIDSRTYLPASVEVLRVDPGSGAERTLPLVRGRFQWKLRPAVRIGSRIARQAINIVPPGKEGGACRHTA